MVIGAVVVTLKQLWSLWGSYGNWITVVRPVLLRPHTPLKHSSQNEDLGSSVLVRVHEGT